MSAPVLSVSEQKKTISGKRNKKKTMKNVLSIPNNLKVDFQFVDLVEAEKLNNILNRLLPSARLPDQQKAKSNRDSIKGVCGTNPVAEIKNRRNQLALGVNAVSRSIKKELISAVLLATDIQPKFLVHHLNLLCSHNQVPFLHFPELRNITKNNLGFPCIAVGFKKNYCDFSEVIEEIKLISETKKTVTDEKTVGISVVNSSSEESEEEVQHNENSEQHDETPFTYLLRKSTKERIFVPEKCNVEKKSNVDFITVDKDNSEIKLNNQSQLGISDKLIRKRKSILLLKSMKKDDEDDDDDDDNVDLQVPKKKKKKDWVIDKVGTPHNYFPANLRRVPSNPNRNRKK